ncbi:DUF1304 family protein [Ruegeria sp. Ofav3-42]|uniref:DUF1304 family protein n=1 Tax=Ruegeria sp. Ofav3-42 TaxID=2917759 RepID=UPI001EF5B3DB|nr:DUF1304 family protein [Ruegeria sp. Ofav3-42]MCG7519503.1 DUF1304 family protein [Ruegeria sp. Ofav3-42]
MIILYYLALAAVIIGHLVFAYAQWFHWQRVCERLTIFDAKEIEKTRFLGRSIASYNASIGVGLCLSIFLPDISQAWTQAVVLGFIVLTAMVGNAGARGNFILYTRLSPAAIALVFLIISTWF